MALGLAIVAVGFGVLTMLTPDTPYLVIAAAFTLLGAGMSITAAPATSEIMTSVPLSKAGVGSAVNDTTRELGGALGIALLGQHRQHRLPVRRRPRRVELPPAPRGRRGVHRRRQRVAERVPGGGEVVAQAASAFTDAFTLTNTVAVGIALAAAAAVLAFSRRPAANRRGRCGRRRRHRRPRPRPASGRGRRRARMTAWSTWWPPLQAGGGAGSRVERSRRVILEAVLDELGEVGYGALTIEAVAARAGVGKSTIYRHWPGKLELVEDAFRTLKAPVVVPEHGTLRDRVIAILEQVACLVQESTYSACMPALIDAAERDPNVRDFHSRFSAERRRS